MGYLISNRCDAFCGTYDVYDLNGNLVQAALITTPNGEGTGIAFNGTDFYVSDIFEGKYWVFDTNGNLLQTISISGYNQSPLVEDLSFNYQQVLQTPEPGSLLMFGSSALALAGLLRRKLIS